MLSFVFFFCLNFYFKFIVETFIKVIVTNSPRSEHHRTVFVTAEWNAIGISHAFLQNNDVEPALRYLQSCGEIYTTASQFT